MMLEDGAREDLKFFIFISFCCVTVRTEKIISFYLLGIMRWFKNVKRFHFKGHVNPKNIHFLSTWMFSKYIKYTKGTIHFFSKVHFRFVKALPNSKHSPS